MAKKTKSKVKSFSASADAVKSYEDTKDKKITDLARNRLEKTYEKTGPDFTKIFTPILALITVLLVSEFLLIATKDFGLVYPYKDYFFSRKSETTIYKGEPWTKKEFENEVIRDSRMQHVREMPNLAEAKNLVFLLGDSITESASTAVDKTYYTITDDQREDITIAPLHIAGTSMRALTYYMANFDTHVQYQDQSYKPGYAVIQIRAGSYMGGDTRLFDPKIGKIRDFQDKLPDPNLSPVVKAKKNFLEKFKLDVKFTENTKDKIFRALVLGKIHILSLLSYKFFHWSRVAASTYPNNENLYANQYPLEEYQWARFEKSIYLLKNTARSLGLKLGILLVPEPKDFRHYQRTQKLNKKERRYEYLFAKHDVPFEYAIEEFYDKSLESNQAMFWKDNHPNYQGTEATSRSLEKLLDRIIK